MAIIALLELDVNKNYSYFKDGCLSECTQ